MLFAQLSLPQSDKAPNSTTIMHIKDGSKTVSDSKQITKGPKYSHFVNVRPRLASRIGVKSGYDPLCRLLNRTEETVFQLKHVNERTVLKIYPKPKARQICWS